MPRSTLAQASRFAPNLAIPLSARTMRVAFPRTTTGATFGVLWVEVTAGGSGYTNGAAVTFTGGGGSGATGVMLVRGGVVFAVLITAVGDNYTSAPTPVFTAGGGSSAAGTAHLTTLVSDLRAAFATDCVWHYLADSAFNASVVAAGIRLQGTLSGQITYDLGNTALLSAATLAFNGQPVPVGFLPKQSRTFGASWRAAYRTYQSTQLATVIASGVGAVQFDDPASDLLANRSVDPIYSGGPFDSETLAAFGQPGLVAAIQAQSVTQDSYNWTAVQANQQYVTESSNWNTTFNAWTGYAAFVSHLKAGVRALHSSIRSQAGSRLYTVNAYDPFPKDNSSAWILPSADGTLFETDPTTYSGASIGNAERYTRIWVNVKTCEGAGTLCIPHLQPLQSSASVNSGATPTATRTARVSLLLKQTALCYALGARPTYPYDIFLLPWDATLGNERWFAKSSDGFVPLFQFVRDYPELFDNTVSRNALLLAYDTGQDSQTNANIMTQADTCLRNGVPATIYPLGAGYSRNPAAEAGALRVINCSGLGTASPSTLTAAIPRIVELSSFGTSNWAAFSAGRLTGTLTDCFAIPRIGVDAYICHVVNFDSAAKTDLVLTVPWWALANLKRNRVTWYAPGAAPVELANTATDTGLRVTLPSMTDWGVLRVGVA